MNGLPVVHPSSLRWWSCSQQRKCSTERNVAGRCTNIDYSQAYTGSLGVLSCRFVLVLSLSDMVETKWTGATQFDGGKIENKYSRVLVKNTVRIAAHNSKNNSIPSHSIQFNPILSQQPSLANVQVHVHQVNFPLIYTTYKHTCTHRVSKAPSFHPILLFSSN